MMMMMMMMILYHVMGLRTAIMRNNSYFLKIFHSFFNRFYWCTCTSFMYLSFVCSMGWIAWNKNFDWL